MTPPDKSRAGEAGKRPVVKLEFLRHLPKKEIEKRLKSLEEDLEHVRNGKHMHFTSNNVAILLDRICDFKELLATK